MKVSSLQVKTVGIYVYKRFRKGSRTTQCGQLGIASLPPLARYCQVASANSPSCHRTTLHGQFAVSCQRRAGQVSSGQSEWQRLPNLTAAAPSSGLFRIQPVWRWRGGGDSQGHLIFTPATGHVLVAVGGPFSSGGQGREAAVAGRVPFSHPPPHQAPGAVTHLPRSLSGHLQ